VGSARYAYELSRLALADADGIAGVIKVYMDESGTHEGSPVVAVAAYFGRPKTWMAFTKEWNIAKRPINVFHSVDCANYEKEFEGWNQERRDPYVANLLPVLARHKIAGVSVSMKLQDLKEVLEPRPDLMQLFGNPYTACFRITTRLIVEAVEAMGSNERLAFIHEDNDYQHEAIDAFNFVKSTRDKHYGPMTLTFGAKDQYVPLQAADVLAYESNKRVRKPESEWRRSFTAINPGDTRCTVLYYPKDKLSKLIESLERAQREAKTLPEPFSLYGKVPTFLQSKQSRKRARTPPRS